MRGPWSLSDALPPSLPPLQPPSLTQVLTTGPLPWLFMWPGAVPSPGCFCPSSSSKVPCSPRLSLVWVQVSAYSSVAVLPGACRTPSLCLILHPESGNNSNSPADRLNELIVQCLELCQAHTKHLKLTGYWSLFLSWLYHCLFCPLLREFCE